MNGDDDREIRSRPSLQRIYMDFAQALGQRSTCKRLQVGTVITNMTMTNVLAIGYNGNAKGFPNTCDSDVPGMCGCIHSETNALIKAPPGPKIVFVSHAPCVQCAKLMVNADVKFLYWLRPYRAANGLELLKQAGVEVIQL